MPGAPDGGGPDGGGSDAGDPRCATQAVMLGAFPHAKDAGSDLQKIIGDIRGWHGQLYFAYGDFELNLGPTYITSLDPKTMTWTDHKLAYRGSAGAQPATDAFSTFVIERFIPIGDALYAPAGQPMASPFGADEAPEYAVGTADHQWTQVDIAPRTLHVTDAIERAPGDVLLTGSAQVYDAGFQPWYPSGFVWRSLDDGGTWQQIFPDGTAGGAGFDFSGCMMYGAALDGSAYIACRDFIYVFKGDSWDYERPFGEFLKSASFAGQLVFANLGQLYTSDGTTRHNPEFRLWESHGRYQGLLEPLSLLQVTEGHLLAVRYDGSVMMTTDLQSWSCIGQVPAEASSITSLDGTVYFGGVDGGVFGYVTPSW
jgi:hypothetical protein